MRLWMSIVIEEIEMAFEYLTNVPLDQAKKDYLNKLR